MNILSDIIDQKFQVSFKDFENPPVDASLFGSSGTKITFTQKKDQILCKVKKKSQSFEVSHFPIVLTYLKNAQEHLESQAQLKELTQEIGTNSLAKDLSKTFKNSFESKIASFLSGADHNAISPKSLKKTFLGKYTTIVFASLEKGSFQADIFDYSFDKFKTSKTPSQDFNLLFKTIKKAKRDYFFDHEVVSNSFQLVGHALATVFNIFDKNIIFILSDGSVLPPTKVEIDQFVEMSEQIKDNLSIVSKRSHTQELTDILLNTFSNIDQDVSIFKKGKSILSNNNSSLPDNKFTFANTELSLLYGSKNEEGSDNIDFFQHQRIKLLGELFNILKHELSNPIFGINMGLKVLESSYEKSDFQELFQEILNSSNRSLDIFNTMTELFSAKARQKNISIKEILNNLKLTLKSELRHVRFQTKSQSTSQLDELIQTNPSIVNQILFNLSRNAIQELKKIPTQKRDLTISVETQASTVSFLIKDNAAGVPENIQESLFHPVRSQKSEGSGLGLSISRNLALKINANLSMKETSSQGTIFELKVPKKSQGKSE